MSQANTPPVAYRTSFRTVGLCIYDSTLLAQRYLVLGDWDQVRADALSQNLLQTRTQSTAQRRLRELVFRLSQLKQAELEFLTQAPQPDQALILWLALCRGYPFIAEFATEVLRERYLSLKVELPVEEYDAFFNRKAQWHPELDSVSAYSHYKLGQVLFRLMREAGLLSTQHTIQGVQFSPQFAQLLRQGQPEEALYFPTLTTLTKT